MTTLTLRSHYAGFFSSCSLRLFQILIYVCENKRLPLQIDNRPSFVWYNPDRNRDVFKDFFDIHENVIPPEHFLVETKFIPYESCGSNISVLGHLSGAMQYLKYGDLQLDLYYTYVEKYFSPTPLITSIKEELIMKYSIDFSNICVLFLRGNDKNKECSTPGYDLYKKEAMNILLENPSIQFLIQSDEREFVEEMSSAFPNNIVFRDEIRLISSDHTKTVDNDTPVANYHFVKNFIAIVLIMSQCKYIVCNSGNISLWIVLFRRNTRDVIQL